YQNCLPYPVFHLLGYMLPRLNVYRNSASLSTQITLKFLSVGAYWIVPFIKNNPCSHSFSSQLYQSRHHCCSANSPNTCLVCTSGWDCVSHFISMTTVFSTM